MVAGKLLILVVTSPALANEINNPRFFEYRTGSFINEVAQISFGWFKNVQIQSILLQLLQHFLSEYCIPLFL